MTAAEFKKEMVPLQGKESAAYQEHFIDLCRLLGQPTPVEADPSGNDFFCFQKRVVKGAEFLNRSRLGATGLPPITWRRHVQDDDRLGRRAVNVWLDPVAGNGLLRPRGRTCAGSAAAPAGRRIWTLRVAAWTQAS